MIAQLVLSDCKARALMAWELERVAAHQGGCGSAAVCLVVMQVRAPTSNLSRPLRSQLHQLGPMTAQLVLSDCKARALMASEIEGSANTEGVGGRCLCSFWASHMPPPQICPDSCAQMEQIRFS
jgi:hypothetical protein